MAISLSDADSLARLDGNGILCHEHALWSAAMPTRNVVLTDHQSELIERLVTSGRYQNASEVLREGLRLIEVRDMEDQARLETLRAAIQVGIDDIEAGRYTVLRGERELKSHLKRLADAAIAGLPAE
ncbi:putative transcriptional regulator containing the CopG/Arc/MetJ DNA-binding domain [Paramagnetospirillum magnetotacticum MS-1]|jgi:antitoxin ParD1/3/4|uniref:Putative transcriptional regulator containing the CopG/Arc/MetJ DNA-binding domain n=1 Tax=Paramagnetospirillum magnetotacticum MS-1 TaxID=272627 RepID=A0A0C2YT09_PARME|nr:putative transcriptional regulator containing the CopG/Arc/MetJ DNA-binding domain [Paramagnetospirillum magnetotacticum MS-1]